MTKRRYIQISVILAVIITLIIISTIIWINSQKLEVIFVVGIAKSTGELSVFIEPMERTLVISDNHSTANLVLDKDGRAKINLPNGTYLITLTENEVSLTENYVTLWEEAYGIESPPYDVYIYITYWSGTAEWSWRVEDWFHSS